MSADKVGGALLLLPQEIRDEIYGHYFKRSYLVTWALSDADGNNSTHSTIYDTKFSEEEEQDSESESLFRDLSDSDRCDLADLAILRTCKSIHSDAKNFLYSKAGSKATTFKYIIEHDSGAMYKTPPTREATDRMMNVEFEVPVYRYSLSLDGLAQGIRDYEKLNIHHDLYSRMHASCGTTIDRFAGTSIIRNSFRITLEVGFIMYNHSIGCLVESPFFQTLRRFIGFQKVTVVLQSSVLSQYAPDSEARNTVRKFQEAFKPHLGPSIERAVDNTIQDRVDGATTLFYVEIDFEPRNFHIENLRAQATRLKKKAHGLRKQANRMIDEVHRLEG